MLDSLSREHHVISRQIAKTITLLTVEAKLSDFWELVVTYLTVKMTLIISLDFVLFSRLWRDLCSQIICIKAPASVLKYRVKF